MRRNRLTTSIFSVVVTLSVVGGLLIPSSKKDDPAPPPALCDLYPIALDLRTLQNASPGAVLPDILNGTEPGNFGWLSWNGQLGLPTLARSLTPPGDSGRYVNPQNPADRDVSVGDSVRSQTGAVNALAVRKALDLLKTLDARVPVWDQNTGPGATRPIGWPRSPWCACSSTASTATPGSPCASSASTSAARPRSARRWRPTARPRRLRIRPRS